MRWAYSVLLGLYILGIVGNYLVPGTWPFRIAFATGLVLFLVAFGLLRTPRPEFVILLPIGGIVVAGLLLHSFAHGERPEKALFVPGNLAIAALILRGAFQPLITAASVYLFALGFGALFLSVVGTQARALVLYGTSQNMVSVVAIFTTVLHYIVLRQDGVTRLPILPAIACFGVCVVGMGRSGIIASAILVAGLFFLRSSRPIRPFTFLASATAFTLFLGLAYAVLTTTGLGALLQRFADFGFDSPERLKIYSDYVASLEHSGAWLVGFPEETTFAGWRNVHNSFLLWHRWLGILAGPLLVLTLGTLLFYLVNDRVNALLFGVVLLRAFFDESLLPFWMFDFLFYFFVTNAVIRFASAHSRRHEGLLTTPNTHAMTC